MDLRDSVSNILRFNVGSHCVKRTYVARHFLIDATWRVLNAATYVFDVHFVTQKITHSQLRTTPVTISAPLSFEAFLPGFLCAACPSPAKDRIALHKVYVVIVNTLATSALRD